MKTKKNNMNNANEVCNVLENGKEVFAAAKETTSAKRCKLHTEQVSTTAKSVETLDFAEKAYNVLQAVELEKAKSTVPVSVLVSAMTNGEGEITAVVNSVLEYNKAVNVRNARTLWKAFASWYKNQRGTDFETWRKTLHNERFFPHISRRTDGRNNGHVRTRGILRTAYKCNSRGRSYLVQFRCVHETHSRKDGRTRTARERSK